MAENKKSFILYSDLISVVAKLPDEIAGKLFKIILEYVNDKNPVVDDLLLNIAFEPIKLQLKRDLVKWTEFREKQSENGKKGGRPKKPKPLNKNPKNPSLNLKSQKSLNATVNATVNANVTVTDTANVSQADRQIVFSFFKTHKSNVFEDSQIERCAENFYKHCDEIVGWNKIKNWRKMADKWIENEIPEEKNEPSQKRRSTEV